jgi:DNA-directed RNA polymerase specialized sigma24 family protein
MDEVLFPMMQAPDAVLVDLALEGDRIAFGCLYLRHYEAAWRVASVAAGWGPDAEVAVIEGFTTAFGALPADSRDDAFRPALLSSVRESALARPARRAETALSGELPGTSADGGTGDLVLGDEHLVREALGAVCEPARTALWMTEVEAMTPAEVGAMLDLDPAAVLGWVELARHDLRDFCLAAYQRQEAPAACRFTAEHLVEYVEQRAPEAEAGLVARHLDQCLACRVRHGEVSNLPGSMLATLDPPPSLGGECQRHWLANRRTVAARPSCLAAPTAAPAPMPIPAVAPIPAPGLVPAPRSRRRWAPLVGAGVAGLALLLGAVGAPTAVIDGARTLSATGFLPAGQAADPTSEAAADSDSTPPSVRTSGRVSSRRPSDTVRPDDEHSASLASAFDADADAADSATEAASSAGATPAGLAGNELSMADVVQAGASPPPPILRAVPPAAPPPGAELTVPAEPMPTELPAADPLPADPLPADPLPADPIVTDPIPTEPVPSEPVPAEPVPVDPVADDPAPTESAPAPAPPVGDSIMTPPPAGRPESPWHFRRFGRNDRRAR